MFEEVGETPQTVIPVGAGEPVGVEEEQQVQYHHPDHKGWEYELDPRYERSPAPTPEPEPVEIQARQARDRFVTRSGQQWGLISSAADDYEKELEDYLGRPGQDQFHPSDARIPLWSGNFSPHSLAALASQAVGGVEPRSWREAMTTSEADQWRAAAKDEMNSLIKAQVFKSVHRSIAGGRVVSSKWVFKVKRHSDGSIERYKARLVARGFSQQPGIDYDETFAPVAKFQSIRLILALAAMHDLELHQMDVKTAFLYGSLEELVFMEQPEGFERGENMVWQLIKSLYGLKQSPRTWYKELDGTLQALGFKRTISDHSIYVRNDSKGLIIVGVYVDDLTIAAASLETLVQFKSEMSRR